MIVQAFARAVVALVFLSAAALVVFNDPDAAAPSVSASPSLYP